MQFLFKSHSNWLLCPLFRGSDGGSLWKQVVWYWSDNTEAWPSQRSVSLILNALVSGDVVCDPMCGSGSIPLEAAMAFPKSYIICGDNFPSAGEKTLLNAQEMERKRGRNLQNLDVLQWDIVGSPLRPGSVDVWISDFPFGKRHKCDRRTLYPKALTAMAEASKVGVSRAVILTMDRRAMSQAVKSRKHWHIKRMVNINVGGLSACVYSMVRTCFVWDTAGEDRTVKLIIVFFRLCTNQAALSGFCRLSCSIRSLNFRIQDGEDEYCCLSILLTKLS